MGAGDGNMLGPLKRSVVAPAVLGDRVISFDGSGRHQAPEVALISGERRGEGTNRQPG